MKATFRIVTPAAASAAVAAILLTGCADKPVRIPGGSFVEEPYSGETTSRSQTLQTGSDKTYEAEVIYIENDVPVGPVENEGKTAAQQGGTTAAQQGGTTAAQQGGTTKLQPVEQEPVEASNVPEGSVEYKVVKGDTLWGIGMVYGVSVARLAEINGLDEKAPLRIGQVIMIPPDAKNAVGKPIPEKKDTKPAAATSKPAAATSKPAASTAKPASTSKAQPIAKDGETLYVVKSGDNLSMIAQRHHVKLADLIAANKVDPKATLRIGQTLVIPAAGKAAASTSTTKSATTATTTKTEPATTTKTAATTTKTEPAATTKPATASQPKAGEGTGGIVEPIGGSMGGSASSSAPAASTSKPAAGIGTLPALDPVSSLSDADVISVPIDSESTLEEVANIHDRNLEDLIRLNPEFKPGQKIPAGTAIKMPLF